MAEQPHSAGAVFLSYASEDADAAARICETLRAAGIEVWFDKNELRGGDAWDSKIKKQIHDCALFIPVISANTNARSEGYFRREWRQAKRRLEDMAEDVAFLMPVVIDDTRETQSRVPEEFLGVQWTRLPAGVAPATFANRVRQVLAAETDSTAAARPAAPENREARPLVEYVCDLGSPRYGLAVFSLVAIVSLSAGAYWYFHGATNTPAASSATNLAGRTHSLPDDKSIAVLPFADMSANNDQEYFADGLSEELLNLLAKLPDLRVIGRTSSFQFKGRKEDLRVIGEKLNVAHILQGSVRKSGEKVRITAQLIRTIDGSHLWSETYNRTFDDIFIVQDEIAGEVVKALKVSLFGSATVAHSRTSDLRAYNLVLQGFYFLERRDQKDLEIAVDYFRQALEQDPAYAPAWAGLSRAYATQADSEFVPVAASYERAREAAKRSLALDPHLADGHLAMAIVQFIVDWDWAAADASVRKALELEPGSARALRAAGLLALTHGRWGEAIVLTNKAIERDPLRPISYNNLGFCLLAVNRDSEAEAAFRKALALDPNGVFWRLALGQALLLQGKTAAALEEIQKEKDEAWRLSGLTLAFHALGRTNESDAALTALKAKFAEESAYQIAAAHAYRGEADAAFEWLERAIDQHDAAITEIKADRLLRGLVDDPRYEAFLRRLELFG